MNNKIAVYDYESDSPDPNTCEPVQLAACIINSITLEVIPDSEFVTYMKPIDIDDKDYFDNHLDTISWHANNYKCSPEEIFQKWKDAPDQKSAFESFVTYLAKYNKNPSKPNRFGAPTRCGHNIRRFDDKIIDRLCERHGKLTKGEQNIFNPRMVIDTLDLSMLWLGNDPEVESYAMDALRKHFGIPVEGGHDALKDVKDTSWMAQKYLSLHRTLAPRIQFKGSYKNANS